VFLGNIYCWFKQDKCRRPKKTKNTTGGGGGKEEAGEEVGDDDGGGQLGGDADHVLKEY
jgi:hypothetical protein